MRMGDEYEEETSMTPTVVMTIIAVTMLVALILIVVLIINRKPKASGPSITQASEELSQQSSPLIIEAESDEKEQKLHPEDLDFWDKYPEEKTEEIESSEEMEEVVVENDPATDGKHTLVVDSEGEEEWVLISPYLPKHEYDFTKLVCQSERMKYYENGKQVSFVGIDVSKYQDYIDFVKVKKSGVDFCMIRAGARGYGSGQLIEDEYFSENLKRASDAGLDLGVYFYSQAVSKEEAIEEANFILERLGDYNIEYPIAFDFEQVLTDKARTDNLSKAERTEITKAFLDTISNAGYKTAIYGNKEWLIKKIDMSKLTAYDVWLAQEQDIPDYPYNFTMWQYSTKGTVDGIAGWVDLNISFIDYSEK